MSILLKHLPILQVLFPMFGALFATISCNVMLARLIATSFIAASLLLGLYHFEQHGITEIRYAIGGWQAPIGIEYRLDMLNQPAILYLNAVMLFFLLFCHKLTQSSVLSYIDKKRQHIFYAILLFAHAGYIGILSTNDLFNLYVFIEISSLSAYVLIAQGNNQRAAQGAFDYLILGTIGATLILIGIGFMLSDTGSLNISDIRLRYTDARLLMTACCFFLTGAMLKVAFFPMHFWMVRAYSSAPPIILVYLAGISSIVGCYIVARFLHFAIEYDKISQLFIAFFRPIAIFTILFCSYLAYKARGLKATIVYSAAAQIGYVIFLLTMAEASELVPQFLLLDSINKIALFLLLAYIEERGLVPRLLTAIIMLCSSGVPLTAVFVLKLQILETFLGQQMLMPFAVVIIASAIALLYHYKMFVLAVKNGVATNKPNTISIIPIVIIAMIQLFLVIPHLRLNWTNGFQSEAAQTYIKYVRKDESCKIRLDHLKMGCGIGVLL